MGKVKAVLEQVVEQYVDDNIENLCNGKDCGRVDCRGKDFVDYGSTRVQLPEIICDHLWEQAWDTVMALHESGELVIVNGKLVGAEQ